MEPQPQTGAPRPGVHREGRTESPEGQLGAGTAVAELVALKERALALGYLYGLDFFIHGLPARLSSELVIFGVDGGEYTITYRDMGTSTELARFEDLQVARVRFLQEVAVLAGPRGRGPYAGQPARTGLEGRSPQEVFEQMQCDGRFPPERTWDDLAATAH